MSRNILLPIGRVRATLLVVSPHSREYIALDVRSIRLLESNDIYMELEHGFTVTLPVESVYDVKNRRGNHILYIVFSKTPITSNGRRVLRFEPYDYSITQALADIGEKEVLDKLAEELSKYRRIAEQAKARVLLKVAEDGIKHVESMDEMSRLLRMVVDALISGKIDEARTIVEDKLSTIVRSVTDRYNKTMNELLAIKNQVIVTLVKLGYSKEELEKKSLNELIDLLAKNMEKYASRVIAVG